MKLVNIHEDLEHDLVYIKCLIKVNFLNCCCLLLYLFYCDSYHPGAQHSAWHI